MKLGRSIALSVAAGAAILMAAPSAASAAPSAAAPTTRLVAGVDNNIDVIETVLLYHVVPGATLTSTDALNADNGALTTAQGGTITVDVIAKWPGLVQLVDQDPTDANPYLNPFALNINKANKQTAHGITAVLRPLDLP